MSRQLIRRLVHAASERMASQWLFDTYVAAADDRWEWAPYVQYGWHRQSFVIESRELAGAP